MKKKIKRYPKKIELLDIKEYDTQNKTNKANQLVYIVKTTEYTNTPYRANRKDRI